MANNNSQNLAKFGRLMDVNLGFVERSWLVVMIESSKEGIGKGSPSRCHGGAIGYWEGFRQKGKIPSSTGLYSWCWLAGVWHWLEGWWVERVRVDKTKHLLLLLLIPDSWAKQRRTKEVSTMKFGKINTIYTCLEVQIIINVPIWQNTCYIRVVQKSP